MADDTHPPLPGEPPLGYVVSELRRRFDRDHDALNAIFRRVNELRSEDTQSGLVVELRKDVDVLERKMSKSDDRLQALERVQAKNAVITGILATIGSGVAVVAAKLLMGG